MTSGARRAAGWISSWKWCSFQWAMGLKRSACECMTHCLLAVLTVTQIGDHNVEIFAFDWTTEGQWEGLGSHRNHQRAELSGELVYVRRMLSQLFSYDALKVVRAKENIIVFEVCQM